MENNKHNFGEPRQVLFEKFSYGKKPTGSLSKIQIEVDVFGKYYTNTKKTAIIKNMLTSH